MWEALRLHHGSLLFFEAHLDRLHASEAAIGIATPPRTILLADLVRLLSDNGMGHDAHVRLAAIVHGIKGRVIRGTAANARAREQAEALPRLSALGREAMDACK